MTCKSGWWLGCRPYSIIVIVCNCLPTVTGNRTNPKHTIYVDMSEMVWEKQSLSNKLFSCFRSFLFFLWTRCLLDVWPHLFAHPLKRFLPHKWVHYFQMQVRSSKKDPSKKKRDTRALGITTTKLKKDTRNSEQFRCTSQNSRFRWGIRCQTSISLLLLQYIIIHSQPASCGQQLEKRL